MATFTLGLLFAAEAMPANTPLIPPGLVGQMEARFGSGAGRHLQHWDRFIRVQTGGSAQQRLKRVNRYLNRVPFVEDTAHWGVEDYWATPVEFVASQGGDCEDFVIAKLFTLQAVEIPPAQLRLMYVNALERNQAHMVLLYTPAPGVVPLVLDNLTNTVAPADQRKDLEPVYSFNSAGIWLQPLSAQPQQVRDYSGSLMWEDLRRRLRSEGLDIY
ncbi:transglutaminase-like cysteine peptidase [Microbulbifer aggregans]|uniref:transglutaminase-like cysteine peptidase n=1 Tax=Microbulbifer aggregans TaxID=1769779 RepID=UPI001314283F|nr:transglutaminase-like cysteine peptidase [Microbulbifer aggregans]